MTPDKLPSPFAYAYRYHNATGGTVIRFGTCGREINGGKPIEAIPLYDATALTTLQARLDQVTEALDRMNNYAKCQIEAFSSGRPYLDLTGFLSLCKEADEALVTKGEEV